MKVGGSAIDLVGLYALAAIVNIAATLWAAGVAMRLRTMQAGPIMQMPVFLILFFAPVYVPLSLLHGWIHGVAVVNPLTRVLEAGRGFIGGTPTEVFARLPRRSRARRALLRLGDPRAAERRGCRLSSTRSAAEPASVSAISLSSVFQFRAVPLTPSCRSNQSSVSFVLPAPEAKRR